MPMKLFGSDVVGILARLEFLLFPKLRGELSLTSCLLRSLFHFVPCLRSLPYFLPCPLRAVHHFLPCPLRSLRHFLSCLLLSLCLLVFFPFFCSLSLVQNFWYLVFIMTNLTYLCLGLTMFTCTGFFSTFSNTSVLRHSGTKFWYRAFSTLRFSSSPLHIQLSNNYIRFCHSLRPLCWPKCFFVCEIAGINQTSFILLLTVTMWWHCCELYDPKKLVGGEMVESKAELFIGKDSLFVNEFNKPFPYDIYGNLLHSRKNLPGLP